MFKKVAMTGMMVGSILAGGSGRPAAGAGSRRSEESGLSGPLTCDWAE